VAWLNAGGRPETRSAASGERTREPAKANLCGEAVVAFGSGRRLQVYGIPLHYIGSRQSRPDHRHAER
jgi:hypothetical protein